MKEQELAQAMASVVKSAIAPMLADVKALQASVGSLESRWNDVGALRERIAVLEVRAPITGQPGERGERGEPGVNGKDGAPGLQGKDGADGRDGRDGAAGLNGKDGSPGLNGKDGADGLAGKDGAPGLSPDDFEWDFDPETRNFSITLKRGGTVLAERTNVLKGMRIYRGVYESDRTYEQGDVTSWNGSEWTALAQTKERPGNGDTAWKLTVKHGEKGSRGPDGKPGRDGRDLTQMDATGRKW